MRLNENYKHNTSPPSTTAQDDNDTWTDIDVINDKDIWWDPAHPTYTAHEGRPSCTNCGKPADMNNKYNNGKIKWRDMCYDCHDHRTDKNYLATKFVGKTLY